MHVNGLGSTELNGISRDADCSLVVCIDLGSGLRVVETSKDYAFEVSMLRVDEESSVFGLGRGTANSLNCAVYR